MDIEMTRYYILCFNVERIFAILDALKWHFLEQYRIPFLTNLLSNVFILSALFEKKQFYFDNKYNV